MPWRLQISMALSTAALRRADIVAAVMGNGLVLSDSIVL
jgi:hypothetical protein